MEHIPSREADSRCDGQEISPPFMDPDVHHSVHGSLLLEPILSQMNAATSAHSTSLRSCVASYEFASVNVVAA